MRRVAFPIAVAALLCGPGAAAAMDAPGASPEVTIVYQAYTPARITTLSGSTVMWHNQSPRAHTVTANDGSFGSSQLFSSQMYEHRFDSAGTFPYYCTIHPGMYGEVDVYDVLLDTPARALAPGQALTLHGRAALPPGTPVSIDADEGMGYKQVATAPVVDGGTFEVALHPTVSASYRAVAGGANSPAVALRVVNRKVGAAAARHGRTAVVAVHVAPAAPGATVVLQVASREHFGWWPTRRARLDGHSRARFTLNTTKRLRVRVVLTLRDGATILARSRDVRVAAAHR